MNNQIKMLMFILMIISSAKFNSAFGQATTNNIFSSTAYLGWSTTGHDLGFYFGGPPGTGTQYMQLNGTSAIGWVGISPNFATYFTAPGSMLDVDGNINAGYPSQTDNSAFQIGYNNVLWHNGHPEDIFVGVNAGNGAMFGHGNTYISVLAESPHFGDSAF